MSETKQKKSLWSVWLDDLLALGVLGVVVGTTASLLGRFWWVADLASHFTVYYTLAGCGLFIMAVVLRCRVRAGLALLVLIINGIFIWPVFVPAVTPVASASDVLKLAQINVLHMNRDSSRVGEFLRGCEADLVFVQEVDLWWDGVLREMDIPYRVAVSRPEEGSFGIALLAHKSMEGNPAISLQDTRVIDFAGGFDDAERPAIQATLLFGGKRVRMLSVHPPPPVSAKYTLLRDTVLRRAKEWADEQSDPHLVMGDLNTTPWSYAFSILTGDDGLVSTLDGRGNQGTWPTSIPTLCMIPIDHCLISEGLVCVDRSVGSEIGSDHLPLSVSLTHPPSAPPTSITPTEF